MQKKNVHHQLNAKVDVLLQIKPSLKDFVKLAVFHLDVIQLLKIGIKNMELFVEIDLF
jgi:hypothetical protein